MQDKDSQALAALQAAKQKGLTYFDAVQGLKAQGFTQENIDNASNQFEYSPSNKPQETASQKAQEQLETDEKDALQDARQALQEQNLDKHEFRF